MKPHATFVLCLLLAAGGASAQTLYKLVDKNGKVTYAEKAPEHFDGQVIPMTIDPNANTATLPKPQAAPAPGKATFAEPVGVVRKTPADTARENVEKARKALQEARDNPSEGDFRFIANAGAGTGTRRVPTEGYIARVNALEAALKKAEAEADRLNESK